jgi:hypothetical protein
VGNIFGYKAFLINFLSISCETWSWAKHGQLHDKKKIQPIAITSSNSIKPNCALIIQLRKQAVLHDFSERYHQTSSCSTYVLRGRNKFDIQRFAAMKKKWGWWGTEQAAG